jgi:RNA polymerase-binding protein DksA
MGMEQSFLQELSQKLKKEQARLRQALFAVADEKKSFEPKFEEMGSDMEASTDEAEQFEVNIGTEHALEPMLVKVEHALDKIERGSYGVCEKCGAEIPAERLKAAPEAEYCVEHTPEE